MPMAKIKRSRRSLMLSPWETMRESGPEQVWEGSQLDNGGWCYWARKEIWVRLSPGIKGLEEGNLEEGQGDREWGFLIHMSSGRRKC